MHEERPSSYIDGDNLSWSAATRHVSHAPSRTFTYAGAGMLLGSIVGNIARCNPNRLPHTISNRCVLIGPQDEAYHEVTR